MTKPTGVRDNPNPRTQPVDGYATCSKCGQTKPAEKFARREDGSLRRLYCYDCKYQQDRRSSMNNKYVYKYGITLGRFEEMVVEQNGLCAICQTTPVGAGKNAKLHVDHDHKTGKVRALLCSGCNSGLGYFQDNTELVLAAYEYLMNYKED
jgi:hypothetical protein